MPARTPGEPDDTERVLSGSGGGGWCRRYSDAWPPTSRAPMWRKSLYLKGGTTGAMWVKQHLTRSYDRGHLRPKGMRGQEHDAKRLMRLSTNRQEVSQLGRVW